MNYAFKVPESKKVRVIINTDCANEADDHFAIVHALLTPKFIVKGIVAGHFENRPDQGKQKSMNESYDEINKVLSLMDKKEIVDVYKGACHALTDETNPSMSEGAQFIVEEALRDDPLPLFVLNLGAITDLATAYLIEPKIEERLTAIWIGGGKWPVGGFEFNLMQDIHAANALFKSKMQFWQVPKDVYKKVRTTLSELQLRVMPYGKVGNFLFKQMIEFNEAHGDNLEFPEGESWVLGDQPVVSLLIEFHEHSYDWRPAPLVSKEMFYIHEKNNEPINNRPIRVYNDVDSRMTLEDLFSKLVINYSK
ncbi:nucleoside hydrolase [Amphibacillus sp. Q70]|uniref:nucleoside hydrolase n=1 Tax=Amphibacillus sp. Q70 TaxID=3453416 RepID=UPI003F87FB38